VRSRGLRRRTPLKAATEEKPRSSLAPISQKKLAEKQADDAAAREQGGAFRARIHGERCVVCGRSEAEAYEETGWGHEAQTLHVPLFEGATPFLSFLGTCWSATPAPP
jgi:hypothetical protein